MAAQGLVLTTWRSSGALGLVMLVAEAGFTCDCLPNMDPSLEAQVLAARDDAASVFVGTVLEVKKDLVAAVARFRVQQAWKGPREGELLVATPSTGGACGVAFEVGRQYLIYARGVRDDPEGPLRLSTGICTRTRFLDAATADLEPLSLAPSSLTLCGEVLDSGGGRIPGSRVTIIGKALPHGERNTVGDPQGRFCIPSVPPGEYLVTADVWDGQERAPVPISIDGVEDLIVANLSGEVRIRIGIKDREYGGIPP